MWICELVSLNPFNQRRNDERITAEIGRKTKQRHWTQTWMGTLAFALINVCELTKEQQDDTDKVIKQELKKMKHGWLAAYHKQQTCI